MLFYWELLQKLHFLYLNKRFVVGASGSHFYNGFAVNYINSFLNPFDRFIPAVRQYHFSGWKTDIAEWIWEIGNSNGS